MNEDIKFEELLKQLDDVVKSLESGDLSLDESIKQYQKGIELSNKCRQKLETAKEVVVKKMDD
ncbi:MAG: exodeoxyribonuclease VII small subunit [Bacilli bacterium]